MPISSPERPSIWVLVEHDETRKLLKSALPADEYEIHFAGGHEVRFRTAQRPPNVVILDLAPSPSNGLRLCRDVRTAYSGPILALGPQEDEGIRVGAFDVGIDQYLPKPFSANEMRARVRALLRRFPDTGSPPAPLRVGDLEIDIVERRFYRAGSEVMLTATEFELLVQLAQNPNHVINSSVLLRKVWGSEHTDPQTLRVHIAHLRKKIEPDPARPRYILTVQGVGYRLARAPETRKAKGAAGA